MSSANRTGKFSIVAEIAVVKELKLAAHCEKIPNNGILYGTYNG